MPGLTLTCTVSVWFVPVGFVAVCGVIWMFASTQFLVALSQLLVQPGVTFAAVPVVRVTVPLALVKLIAEVACTGVTRDGRGDHDRAARGRRPARVVTRSGEPTKLPVVLGGVRMVAVAVPLASTPPLVAVTVIVSVWFVPTALVAFCGVIWMNASTHVLGRVVAVAGTRGSPRSRSSGSASRPRW